MERVVAPLNPPHPFSTRFQAGRPLGRRTVVACPSSLVDNWAAEAKKWLGDERFKVIALRPGPGVDAPGAVAGFLHGGVHPCLVASYEALRKVGPALAGRVDLLVCDEGHRLKATAGNQTIAALKAIGCKRTVLLTGERERKGRWGPALKERGA